MKKGLAILFTVVVCIVTNMIGEEAEKKLDALKIR